MKYFGPKLKNIWLYFNKNVQAVKLKITNVIKTLLRRNIPNKNRINFIFFNLTAIKNNQDMIFMKYFEIS